MGFIVPLCLILLSLEVFLRWRVRKTPPPVSEDVLRLRDETRALRQDDVAHAVRIVAFGDSIPHGWGLEYSDSYPALLEHMFGNGNQDHGLRVINAGIPGNTIVLGWQRLKRDVLRWKPHIVLVAFGLNDTNLARSVYDERRERALKQRLTHIGRVKAALRSSLLWSTVVDTLKGCGQGTGAPLGVDEVPKEPLPRTSRQVFEMALKDIVQHIRCQKAQAVLLTMTPVSRRFLRKLGGGGQISELMKRYNDIIRQEAQRTGSLLIDANASMISRSDVESLIGWDGVHFNAKGQEALAQIIHKALADSAILSSATYSAARAVQSSMT